MRCDGVIEKDSFHFRHASHVPASGRKRKYKVHRDLRQTIQNVSSASIQATRPVTTFKGLPQQRTLIIAQFTQPRRRRKHILKKSSIIPSDAFSSQSHKTRLIIPSWTTRPSDILQRYTSVPLHPRATTSSLQQGV